MNWFRRLLNYFWRPKCYESIRVLPVMTWHNVHMTQDYGLLLISGKPTDEYLNALWLRLQNEQIREFGFSEHYKSYLQTLKRYGELLAKSIGKDDTILTLQVKQKQSELLAMGRQETVTIEENIAAIERFMGRQMRDLTTHEYYTYMKVMEKAYKRKKAETEKNGKKGRV